MRIEIIGTESLGVRGLCTVVTTAHRHIANQFKQIGVFLA